MSRVPDRSVPLLAGTLFEVLEPRTFLSAADLIVESASAPASARFGDAIEIEWIVRNAGTEATGPEAGWLDGVYLSTDTILDETDLLLGVTDTGLWAGGGGPLAPGTTYSAATSALLPLDGASAPGTYYLFIAADAWRMLEESNEENNSLVAGTIELTVPPLPDLVVDSVTTPGPGQFGGTLGLTWTIRNAGPGEAMAPGWWSDAVYLSTDDVLDETDLALEVSELSVRSGDPLAPAGSFVVEADVSLPLLPGLTPGTFHLIVAADGYGVQLEGDETNNALATGSIEIAQPPPPDLVVEGIVAPVTGEFGQSQPMSWTVRNNGAGPAPMGWYESIYLSTDPVLDGGDLELALDGAWAGQSGILAPGHSLTVEVSVWLPLGAGAAGGEYYLIVLVDAGGMVEESDESNNAAPSAPVVLGIPAPADLVVESGIAPGTGELGQNIQVSWIVRNTGPGVATTAGWYDGVYLSLDDEIGIGDLSLGGADPGALGIWAVGPGESYQAEASLWLIQDGTIQPGTYRLIVLAGVGGQFYEANTANNALVIGTIEITGTIVPPEFGPGGTPLSGGFVRSESDDGGASPLLPAGATDRADDASDTLRMGPTFAAAQLSPRLGGFDASDDDASEDSESTARTIRRPAKVLRVASARPGATVRLSYQ